LFEDADKPLAGGEFLAFFVDFAVLVRKLVFEV
jgi:hypothetical protein